ncbi:hypothetical protein HOY80DRAFT_1080296 [Tuber brumale]|nr:hypothetical protein HOY80DRAFT_1080296 [Tuber brumale]
MAGCPEVLRMRIAGEAILGKDEEFQTRGGDEEAGGLFSEYQQRAKQRLLPDLVGWGGGGGSAGGRHGGCRLVAIQFMRNAEASQKRANKAEIVGLRQISECDHGSHKSDEDEHQGNDTGIMIYEAGRKNLEVARKPKPKKPEFGEAERWSEDQDGKVSPDEVEVTIVNKASYNIPKKPVSKPGVSRLLVSNLRAIAREMGSSSTRLLGEGEEGKVTLEPNTGLAQASTFRLLWPKAQALASYLPGQNPTTQG